MNAVIGRGTPLRRIAGRIKRGLLRVARFVGGGVRRGTRFLFVLREQWRAFQHEVRAHRVAIRALEERYVALSARTTALQREIEPLRSVMEPAIGRYANANRLLTEEADELRRYRTELVALMADLAVRIAALERGDDDTGDALALVRTQVTELDQRSLDLARRTESLTAHVLDVQQRVIDVASRSQNPN